jgi:hypothetical protein
MSVYSSTARLSKEALKGLFNAFQSAWERFKIVSRQL